MKYRCNGFLKKKSEVKMSTGSVDIYIGTCKTKSQMCITIYHDWVMT